VDATLRDSLKTIPEVTDAMITAMDGVHCNTPKRIGNCSADELAGIMGTTVHVAREVLDLEAIKPHVKSPPPAAPAAPPGAGSGPLQLQIVDPTDLRGLTHDEVASRFGDEAKQRDRHLQQEFRRRTGGLILVDPSGQYLPQLTVRLMTRVERQGPYTGKSFTYRKQTGQVMQLDEFLKGMAITWQSPFTGETLDEEGHDPNMDLGDVSFPVGDEDAMVRIGWVVSFGRGFDWDDPETCANVILMATGKKEPSKKVRPLLEACALAVTTRDRKLEQARAEVVAETNPGTHDGRSATVRPEHQSPVPSGNLVIPGPVRVQLSKRLFMDWQQLAIALDIPSQDQRAWERGQQVSGILNWLDSRDQLGRLPAALQQIGRDDLIRDFFT
jgi:hypothetical protein